MLLGFSCYLFCHVTYSHRPCSQTAATRRCPEFLGTCENLQLIAWGRCSAQFNVAIYLYNSAHAQGAGWILCRYVNRSSQNFTVPVECPTVFKQCGVMRAAATHTTSQAKLTWAVLLCRVQTTDCSSPGSERGPAPTPWGRGRPGEGPQEDPHRDHQERPRELSSSDPRSWTSRSRSVGDVVCAIVSYFVFIEFKLCTK